MKIKSIFTLIASAILITGVVIAGCYTGLRNCLAATG